MEKLDIGDIFSKKSHPAFIIAEAGVNHNGQMELAKKMIDEAAKIGVNAIKFQTFKTDNLIIQNTPKADYQKNSANDEEDFYSLLKKLEFSYEQFREIYKYCQKKKILFLSTPFDNESAQFLNDLDVFAFKIGSGDFNNYPFLDEVIKYQKPLILSSGMSNIEDVKFTINFLKNQKSPKFALLQCTSAYPTPLKYLNLKVISTYQRLFPEIKIGLSDHSLGLITGACAVSLGAKIIEKHFTLNKELPGPDHKASLTPSELKEYIENIRIAEKCLGSSKKNITQIEKNTKKVARKSIILKKDLNEGEVITPEAICIKRPGTGLQPKNYSKIIGKRMKKNRKTGHILQWGDIV